MDHDFDEALRTLAEHQIRHGVRVILLSVREPGGDVVASIAKPGATSVAIYGRVDRATNKMVRFHMTKG